MNRRELLKLSVALGVSAAWADSTSASTPREVVERRDLFPEGVASGDPDATSVLVWTRCPHTKSTSSQLRLEVAADQSFKTLVAETSVRIEAVSDWTCRVLVGNLKPASVYWYRFVDDEGHASRVGRTITAPADDD